MVKINLGKVNDGLTVFDVELRHRLVASVEARKLLHRDRLERVDESQVSFGRNVAKLSQVFLRNEELEGVVELNELRALPQDGDDRLAGHRWRMVVEGDLELLQMLETFFDPFNTRNEEVFVVAGYRSHLDRQRHQVGQAAEGEEQR